MHRSITQTALWAILFSVSLAFCHKTQAQVAAQDDKLRTEIGWQYAPGWFESDGENISFPLGVAFIVGVAKGNYSFFMPASFHFKQSVHPQNGDTIHDTVLFIGAGMRYTTPFRIYFSMSLGADISATDFSDSNSYEWGPMTSAFAVEGSIGWKFSLTEQVALDWSVALRERRYDEYTSRGFIGGVGMLITL